MKNIIKKFESFEETPEDVESGVLESASTNGMIEDMKLIVKTLHINPSLEKKGEAILKYLQDNLHNYSFFDSPEK